jgi:hypothetical protein
MADNGEPSGSTHFNNVQASVMQKCNSQKKRKQSTVHYCYRLLNILKNFIIPYINKLYVIKTRALARAK